MLKLTGIVKTTPFEFEDMDGKTYELEVSEFTVADMKRLIDIQEPLMGEDVVSTLANTSEMIMASRIICAVKHRGTQDYMWATVKDFTEVGYPNTLANMLYPVVAERNPIQESTVEEKKN